MNKLMRDIQAKAFKSAEIIEQVRNLYDESKKFVFPKDILVPSKPCMELKIVNDPVTYFKNIKGKLSNVYEPVLEYSFLADSMRESVKALNLLSDGYGDQVRLHSVDSNFDYMQPFYVVAHIYFKKPLSRRREVTNVVKQFESNYGNVIMSDFINKDIIAEPRGKYSGKWAMCLTNDPETFWKEIRKQKQFKLREWGGNLIRVKNIGEGIKSTKEFLIKHGGNPEINLFQPNLDINKPMFMAVFVSYE